MTRTSVLSDEMWARIGPVLLPVKDATGRPMRVRRSLMDADVAHEGLGRITRIRGFARTDRTNPMITPSGVRAAT